MSTRRSVRSAALAFILIGGLTGALLTPLAADAALDAPTGLSSSQSTASLGPGNVKLSWSPTPGASAYRVQISTESTFQSSSIVATQRTYALDWIPSSALGLTASRTLYWRVAAYASGISDSTLGPDSSAANLTLDPLAIPATTSPGSLESNTPTTISYPTPVVFTWTPVPGAVGYTIEYSDGTGSPVSQSTTATSFTPTAPLARNATNGSQIHWSWHVQASFYNGTTSATPSITGDFSPSRYFMIDWPTAPANLVPANQITTSYSDVSFSWDAVPGAAQYKLDIGKEKNSDGFSVKNPDPTLSATVIGTKYVPTSTLLDGTYYWQVTPLDVNGASGTASAVYQFKKSWGSQTTPTTTSTTATYPAPLVGTSNFSSPTTMSLSNFQLSWSPLPRATLYKVEVSGNGTPRLTCRTASTSVTIIQGIAAGAQDPNKLIGSATCLWNSNPAYQIQPGQTYSWRVQAIDYAGNSSTAIQSGEPTGVLTSEWSDPEAGDTSRERYVRVVADATGTAGPITLNTADFASTQKIASVLGQPAPLFTWAPYKWPDPLVDNSNVPLATQPTYGYEVRVYDNDSRTSEVAVAQTPSAELRLTGVFDDNSTSQPYYASVRPFEIYNGATTYLANASSSMFSWSKSSKPITLGTTTTPVQTRPDGTVLLSWDPQFTNGSKDGGSRGYQITIARGSTTVGTTKVEYPFYVAQDPTTGKPLAPGAYKFSVAALDANGNAGQISAYQDFSVSIPSPDQLATTVSGSTATLSWRSTASTAKYKVEYKLTSTSTWTAVTDLKQTSFVLKDLVAGNYNWRVTSFDAAGNSSSPSSTDGTPFTVGGGVVSLATANAAQLRASEWVLSWSTVPGASRYLVQIADNNSLSSPTEFETDALSLAIPDVRIAGKAYYWRVRALPETATSGASRPVLAESETRSFTVVTAPGTPAINTLVLDGSSLTATWSALTGSAAGTDVAPSYIVQYRVKSASDDWTGAAQFTTSPAATSFTATGLPDLTTFQFRLAAVNSEGQGPWSAVREASTASAPTAAPTNLKAAPALGSLVLTWSSVTANGGLPITSYTVRARPSGTGAWSVASATGTSTTISGLLGNTSYDFEVAAVNSRGEGPAATLAVTTVSLPSAPLNLRVVRGNQAATLTWQGPVSDGGSPLISYLVEQSVYNPATKSWGSWSSSTTTGLSITKTGLTNAVAVQFRVAATTKLGSGAYAGPIAVTPAGKPIGTTLTVAAKKGKFVLKWKPATANGSAVKTYVVQYSKNNGVKWKSLKTVKVKTRTLTTKIGSKGKTYYFRVIPKNVLGSGTPTPAVAAVRL